MKKIERRALLCLALAGVLALGMVVFLVLFAVNGSGWAAAPFNRHLYNSDGALASGTVLDRDGEVLSTVDEEGNRVYSDSRTTRMATLHVVGDLYGNVGTADRLRQAADGLHPAGRRLRRHRGERRLPDH